MSEEGVTTDSLLFSDMTDDEIIADLIDTISKMTVSELKTLKFACDIIITKGV